LINLSPQEFKLYRQCINEVLRGFHDPTMEQTVGASFAALMKEDAALYAQQKPSAESGSGDTTLSVRPLVIAEAIRLLGIDEFQLSTGFPLEEGYRLLEKAKKAS
jgi:hypothetical protein